MSAPEPELVDLEGAFAIVQRRLGPLAPAKAIFGALLGLSYVKRNPTRAAIVPRVRRLPGARHGRSCLATADVDRFGAKFRRQLGA